MARGGGYPTWVPLAGYPPPSRVPPVPTWLGGTLTGTPPTGPPHPGRRGTLPGYPPGRGPPSWLGGYPTWAPPSRVPPQQGTPLAGPGRVPPRLDLAGYPPRCLPHGILGNVAKHYGIWVPPQVSAPWHSG